MFNIDQAKILIAKTYRIKREVTDREVETCIHYINSLIKDGLMHDKNIIRLQGRLEKQAGVEFIETPKQTIYQRIEGRNYKVIK